MKPSRFTYYAPATVDDALQVLREYGDEAKLLAGGQSLVPLLNLRMAAPAALVDLNRVGGLDYVRRETDVLAIGAMTRHRDVTRSPAVREHCPLLAAAASVIGYPAIRNRGTLGGSVAHADPVGEMPCVALTLDAELVAQGPAGRRTIAARDFFLGYFTTALEPTEVLVELRFPIRGAGATWGFEEFSRKSGDFAVAAVAVDLDVAGGRIGRAAVGVAGVADRPVRAEAVEAVLHGQGADAVEDVLERVRGALLESASVDEENKTASAERAGVLAARAVRQAMTRWEEAQP